jgi:NADH-quinone oxidoreductase subunit A
VQFDLRFYVVALVFIVFDVEVAFLFPIATVFGKANHLADSRLEIVESGTPEATLTGEKQLTRDATLLFQEMGVH